MKAPDKIYIDDLAVVNDCTTKISTKPLPNFSEYIRKEALLEWAKGYKEEADASTRGRTDNPSWGESVAMKNLINKLNSM